MPEAAAGELKRLCSVDEVGEGRSRGFDPKDEGQDSMFLVRTDGVLRAWVNACPHIDGAPMAWRTDGYMSADGKRIVCHGHGAEFLPDTGVCVAGPCLGRSLHSVAIAIDGAGGVWIGKGAFDGCS